MFELFLIACIIGLYISGRTPEEWREVIKNCKEED